MEVETSEELGSDLLGQDWMVILKTFLGLCPYHEML